MRSYCLAHMSYLGIDLLEAIELCSEVGFDGIGVRLLGASAEDGPFKLFEDSAYRSDVMRAAKTYGVPVVDVEIARINDGYDRSRYARFAEIAAILGAKHVLVAIDDRERNRMLHNVEDFAELCAQNGLTADIEFMPWTAAPNLKSAINLVQAAHAENIGILIDALHFFRTSENTSEIACAPRSRINYFQLCDAKKAFDPSDADLIRVARGDRLYPGQGELPLVDFVKAFDKHVPVSVEVPNLLLTQRISNQERLKIALSSAQSIVRLAEI